MLAGILAAAVVAGGMPAWNGGLPGGTGTSITAYAAETTVTWNNNDITGTSGTSFSKDGVTIAARRIDFHDKNFMGPGTFTTTLGNFTKIEVTARYISSLGTGWSGGTWTGNASSVSFSNDIYGMGMGITMVFTIELPTVDVTGVTLNKTSATLTEGETETLTATVAPNGATDKTVTWSSSDETVAAVDANGVVTAVKAGTATITATATLLKRLTIRLRSVRLRLKKAFPTMLSLSPQRSLLRTAVGTQSAIFRQQERLQAARS